jgi:tRNA A37 threonylcarbamoyladenosine biosynthesis protein TsaE
MYRIEDPSQLFHLGLLDQIQSYPYVLIERPKWMEQYVDSDAWLKVRIEKVSETERNITL